MSNLLSDLVQKFCSTCGAPVEIPAQDSPDGSYDYPWCEACLDFVSSKNPLGEQAPPSTYTEEELEFYYGPPPWWGGE